MKVSDSVPGVHPVENTMRAPSLDKPAPPKHPASP